MTKKNSVDKKMFKSKRLIQDKIFFAKATMCLLLMPNISKRAADGPERGKPLTASLWTTIEESAETAEQTASPIPPTKRNKR